MNKTTFKYWIEAMRLRTLPVSAAGVITASGCALADNSFRPLPALMCLIFAILAQISSNFANEYYDFKGGLDKKGREGPRRGVTEGDISPKAMLAATYLTLAIACIIGLSLLLFGGWWLIPVGIAVAIGAVAYSAGPYPLSHHGLGEIAVIAFFGLVPVCCTYTLQTGHLPLPVVAMALATGLMGANVLIINNYRDIDDDRAVGKQTLAVKFGPAAMRMLYLFNSMAAIALAMTCNSNVNTTALATTCGIYGIGAVAIVTLMGKLNGRRLTPLLGATAMLMLLFSTAWAIIAAAAR
ncbi:MAG: 1,4-dihydroxy-2-naphthoate octaprenyltransferase [Paramuribaculum sp.]|nr:1,4-dihydroxy-2-naphthoate octaprenyltransferase [Paramuribaculum sp.]